MLIYETIKVRWNKRNKKILESLGYGFTFYGGELEVNIKDAPRSKSNIIDFKCDECKLDFPVALANYYNSDSYINGKFGDYLCHTCSTVKSKKVQEKRMKNLASSRHDRILSNAFPQLLEEWNCEKNEVDPKIILRTSNKKVWWKCVNGHEWQAKINNRTNFGYGCPYCVGKLPTEHNNLQVMRPELIKEWNFKRNKKQPNEYNEFSHKKVWWICSRGHEWETAICDRSEGNGCPYCSNKLICDDNCLETVFPEIAKEWHYLKNKLTPRHVLFGSHVKVWWICSDENCKHEWEATVHHRTGKRKTGCPVCGVNSGENHYKWQGGITPLKKYIRQKMEPWRIESIKKSRYKCVITGKRFEIIHHLYGFNEIFDQTFEEIDVPMLSKISDYTTEEIKLIEDKCLEIHYRYPLGVGLTNEIHDLFHQEYGS